MASEGQQMEVDGHEDHVELRRGIESYVRHRVPVHETDEVAAEAFFKAVCRWMLVGGSLKRIAYRVAMTCCLDWHRRRGRRGAAEPLPEDVADPDLGMSRSALVRPEVEEMLAWADGSLTPRQRELVRLIFSGEGRTMSELERRMSMSSSTLERALLAVAKKIQSAHGPRPGI